MRSWLLDKVRSHGRTFRASALTTEVLTQDDVFVLRRQPPSFPMGEDMILFMRRHGASQEAIDVAASLVARSE